MATSKFQNRNGDVGRSGGMGAANSVGNDASTGKSYWIAGMIFFGVVAFTALPFAFMLLVKAEKLLAKTEAVLHENKKLKAVPKVEKEPEE